MKRAPGVPLIELTAVSHYYQHGTAVVADVDLAVHAHQFTGLVGPSGSGKTTLLRILLGALAPSTGDCRRAAGLRTGYVPQVEVVNWNFPVTVIETVLMARPAHRVPWATRAEKLDAAAVLERLGIGDLAGRHIRELSGGQQQRVFIARALLGDPDVLLMDEPTSGVDVRTRHDILHLLEELNRDGLAVVLTTHDLNGIAAHLPHLVCLNVTVQGLGAPHDVLTPDILERTYGAPMEVLDHAGMTLVVDRFHDAPRQLRGV
ncbi:MAG: putative metal transporter ATP-binding protein [Acidimicrobiia bacterium]|nr:putative metal transporter ATP-binding protein [Acidimicrobiia bacterium]